MICNRCSGRLFLDRVFTDNLDLETTCLQCGDRKFIRKNTRVGKWLTTLETKLERANNGLA